MLDQRCDAVLGWGSGGVYGGRFLAVGDRGFTVIYLEDVVDIGAFIVNVERKRWKYDDLLEIIASGRASEFVTRGLHELTDGSTCFADCLSFLTVEEWHEAAAIAARAIQTESGPVDGPALDVFEHADGQCVESLHPHLLSLWSARLDPLGWRGAPPAEIARLIAIHDRDPASDDARRAWQCLLATRDPAALMAVVERAALLPVQWRRWSGCGTTTEAWFRDIGVGYDDGRLTWLCSTTQFHLRFDPGYLGREQAPLHLQPGTHPTWLAIGEPVDGSDFGGHTDQCCANCGRQLCHIITFEPVPADLGIESRARVQFVTCLSCLGWVQPVMFFDHDANGSARARPADGPKRLPQFPMTPLDQGRVGLVPTPDRWRFQNWGLSNNRQNLHRVGGEPTWVQDPEYPRCPECAATMLFVFQLADGLPMGDSSDELWGSGGVGYFFWCDRCAVSANLWQCT